MLGESLVSLNIKAYIYIHRFLVFKLDILMAESYAELLQSKRIEIHELRVEDLCIGLHNYSVCLHFGSNYRTH